MNEQGRLVAQKVVRRIGEVAPEGIGHWKPAFDEVREPSEAFLDALNAWEHEDTLATREALQAAADELVRAWRRVGEAWQAGGCPSFQPGRREREEVYA
jgi:hypothetical protein